jgi:hypothetical protein
LVRDPAMLITMFVMMQFFILIILFGAGWIHMEETAKQTLLQTYTVAFTASWGFWLGSSAGSKSKEPPPPTPPQ